MAEASDLAFVETWMYISFLAAQFGLDRGDFSNEIYENSKAWMSIALQNRTTHPQGAMNGRHTFGTLPWISYRIVRRRHLSPVS
jgi:hypothetical protein